MTRHWVEAYVDGTEVGFELTCEHPMACDETRDEHRGSGCNIKAAFDDAGTDLFDFPDKRRVPFGRLEISPRWVGFDEDAELTFLQPLTLDSPDWRRIAVQFARSGGSYYGLTTAERDLLEAEVREVNEADRDVVAERTADAASYHQEDGNG